MMPILAGLGANQRGPKSGQSKEADLDGLHITVLHGLLEKMMSGGGPMPKIFAFGLKELNEKTQYC
jgi:hypothetical protein